MNATDAASLIYQTVDLINARAVREFSVPPRTYIGPGAIAKIGDAIVERGFEKVFVLIDDTLEQLGLADVMYRALRASALDYEVYRQAPREPDTDMVETIGRHLGERSFDVVVAFGGGSILDAAKGAVVLAANPTARIGDIARDPALITKRRMPFFAVPTTAGTGSEATNATVIIDPASHVKHLLIHPDMIPDLAVIDACLTLRTPPRFTAIAGVDAMTHAIEAYVAMHATPLTKALAYRALTLIGEALPVAVGQGNDVQARESMMLASYMAGVAFSNAGLGLCHAMAHQIGGAYDLPHGMANAVLLPSVMVFNQLVCKREFCEIGHALSGRILEPQQTIAHIQDLIVELGLPGNLKLPEVKPDDFDAFAESALNDPSITTNPRTVSKAQIVEVFKHAYARQGEDFR